MKFKYQITIEENEKGYNVKVVDEDSIGSMCQKDSLVSAMDWAKACVIYNDARRKK